MTDDALPAGATPDRRETDHPANAEERVHSDVARVIDITPLRDEIRSVRGEVHALGGRVDGLGDELTGYVLRHAELHTQFAGDWEKRFSTFAVEYAYRKGLIGFPRLVLEWLRQYLPTIITIGSLVTLALGFLTGQVAVDVGR